MNPPKKSSLQPAAPQEQKQEIKEAFDLFDTDGSGSILGGTSRSKSGDHLAGLAVKEALVFVLKS